METLLTRWSDLSKYAKVAFILRCSVLSVCVLLTFGLGHPPAHPQSNPRTVMATEPMVTGKDADQDISLSQLKEFKANQEAWNSQTGKDVAIAKALAESDAVSISHIDGVMGGGLGLITVFTFAAMIFQLRKKTG